jgi:hypothetical protein
VYLYDTCVVCIIRIVTTRWLQVELLDDCVARLLGHFEKGLWERVTAVTRCAKP